MKTKTGEKMVKARRPLTPHQRRGPIPVSPGRARTMQSIRGRGNRSTELRMARDLRRAHLRGWRRHVALPGTPDFVWSQKRFVVFVDGCFWHGCPRCYRAPRHNASFWRDKVHGNRARDRRVVRELEADGWRVVRVWECKVGKRSTIARIARQLSAPMFRRPG